MMDSSGEDIFCLEKIALVGKDVLRWVIRTQMGNLGSIEGFVLCWGNRILVGRYTPLGKMDSVGSVYSAGLSLENKISVGRYTLLGIKTPG